jgi:hypothetical protein
MSADDLDEALEAHGRAVLGERYQPPAPREQSYEELVAGAVEAERVVRHEARKAAQPSMAEFAGSERAKRRPKIPRANLFLDQRAAYGCGSGQRPPGMPLAFGVAPHERFIIEELPETQVLHGVG